MARGRLTLVVTTVCLIVFPATATAAQQYAAPNGSLLSSCSQLEPCEIHRAFTQAGPNDEVIITAGDYGSAGVPLPGVITSSQPGLNVHGEAGQPRPRIFVDTGDDASALSLTGAGTSASHFEIQQRPSFGSRQAALVLDNAQAMDIVAVNTASQGKACVLLHASTLTNSLCRATGTSDTKGVATYTGVGPGVANTSVLRNVTAIASSPTGAGIEALAGNNAGEDQQLTVSNTIARGGQYDVGANNALGGGLGVATVTIDHSNFGFESALPPGSGDRVVDGPGGGNQRFLAVGFVNPTDFHQAAGSPTIDAAATNIANGPTDFDGDPRTLGPGTDIGADEFVPPPSAVTGDPGPVTDSTAVVNATVNPNGVASSYHFEYGATSAYGSSTPEIDAGTGNSNLAAAETLTGLAPATTYYFRIVATSAGGTTAGLDRSVATKPLGGGGDSQGLLSLDLAPRAFAAADRGGSVKSAARRKPPPVGTTVSFELSDAAKVRFTVERKQPGKGFVEVRGRFKIDGEAGENRFRFTGRLRHRALKAGRYRLVGNAGGEPKRAKFKIVAD